MENPVNSAGFFLFCTLELDANLLRISARQEGGCTGHAAAANYLGDDGAAPFDPARKTCEMYVDFMLERAA